MRPVFRRLELRRIDLPFRSRFDHASARRDRTESVLVRAMTQAGATGLGESCPRRYVTGESPASVVAFFERYASHLLARARDVAGLQALTDELRPQIDANPAAWCAMELAALDALAQDDRRSLESLLGLPDLAGTFHYTAILGDASPEAFSALVARYRAARFRDFKIKLSGDLDRDAAKLQTFRDRPGERVRVDANNVWADLDTALVAIRRLNFPFSGIEEPLPAGRIEDLLRLAQHTGIPVILDESLLSADRLTNLPGAASHWIANLRVSKLGGLFRTLEVLTRAQQRGVRVIVGAQVGETSLLTRAALPVAMQAGHLLVGQEGAFGTWLLEHDLFDPTLAFGEAGRLDAPEPGYGFALALADERDDTELLALVEA